jgi:hypothetical protein
MTLTRVERALGLRPAVEWLGRHAGTAVCTAAYEWLRRAGELLAPDADPVGVDAERRLPALAELRSDCPTLRRRSDLPTRNAGHGAHPEVRAEERSERALTTRAPRNVWSGGKGLLHRSMAAPWQSEKRKVVRNGRHITKLQCTPKINHEQLRTVFSPNIRQKAPCSSSLCPGDEQDCAR